MYLYALLLAVYTYWIVAMTIMFEDVIFHSRGQARILRLLVWVVSPACLLAAFIMDGAFWIMEDGTE